jgi:hypothetical protein
MMAWGILMRADTFSAAALFVIRVGLLAWGPG